MIQVLDKQYQVVRTVIESDVNDVLVCKIPSGSNKGLYSLILIKDRDMCSRLLGRFSNGGLVPWAGGFREMGASGSNLILVFDYNNENRLFYYKTLYWRTFADRLRAARSLISELMSFDLPNELISIMLEDQNINLTADGRIYFNYFADLSSLPETVSTGDVVIKAASLTYRILSDGFRTQPKELDLLKTKIERKAFGSFASIYAALRDIPDKLDADITMLGRAKKGLISRKERLTSFAKTAVLVLMLAASLIYTISQLRSRSVPAYANDIPEKYQGLNKIGTVVLETGSADPQSNDTITEQQGE